MLSSNICKILESVKGLEYYPLIAPEAAKPPFAVFAFKSKPLRTKEGIYAYSNDLNIRICEDNLDKLNDFKDEIVKKFESLTGSDDVFKSFLIAEYSKYDNESGLNIADLSFEIKKEVKS